MDWTAAYCARRRDIEENGWALTTRLFSLTAGLLKIIGKDHQAFMALLQECLVTKAAITASNRSLWDHRREHGC
jgi:hypothetical protein